MYEDSSIESEDSSVGDDDDFGATRCRAASSPRSDRGCCATKTAMIRYFTTNIINNCIDFLMNDDNSLMKIDEFIADA